MEPVNLLKAIKSLIDAETHMTALRETAGSAPSREILVAAQLDIDEARGKVDDLVAQLSLKAYPPTQFWQLQQFRVWKGLDPEKRQWYRYADYIFTSWVEANDVVEYLERNDPTIILRVTKHV